MTGIPQRPDLARRVAAMAAMAALTALLVAAVFMLIGIVVHVAAVILALVTLLICATSGWYVVSRRGVVRMIAAAVVLIAAAAFGTGLAFTGITAWRVVVIVVMGAVSVLAARYAPRRTRRQLMARSAPLVRAERPAHPVLIMNPKSGGGKAERFRLAGECRKRGIEAVVLRPGLDLLQLAEDAVARGAEIGVAGGDGSQALVASVAARHDLPYVCVPAGTRNHFALDPGLNRNDVVGGALRRDRPVARVPGREAEDGRLDPA